MSSISRLFSLAALLTVSVGCKQLLKNADEIGSGLARNADSVTDVGRHAPDAAAIDALRKGAGWDHAAEATTSMAKMSLDYGPDLLELATTALTKEGQTVTAHDFDLSGDWTSTSDEDGMVIVNTVERKKTGPATYAVRQVATMSQGGVSMASLASSGVEVFGATHTCFLAAHTEVVKVTDLLPADVQANMRAEFTPATFNDEPCTAVKALDVDTVSTVDDKGVIYTETRVH